MVTVGCVSSSVGEESSGAWVTGAMGEGEEWEDDGWEKSEDGAKVAKPGGVETARGGG